MNRTQQMIQNPQYYAERLGLRFYRRKLIFYERYASGLSSQDERLGIRYKPVAQDYIEKHASIGWLTKHEALALLNRPGFMMYGAFKEGQLVGNCWLELQECDLSYFDLNVPLPSGVAYISRLFVSPDTRGMHISEELIMSAMAEAWRAGKTCVKICCVPGNSAMRHILKKLDFRLEQHVNFTRALMLRLYQCRFPDGASESWTMSATKAGQTIFEIPETETKLSTG